MLSREEAGAGDAAVALISAFGLTVFGIATFLEGLACFGVAAGFFVSIFGSDFLTVFLPDFFADGFFAAFFTFLAGVFFAFFAAAFLARFFDAALAAATFAF